MQSDAPVRYIAVTCPQCGKHYKKVPFEAIKKYHFAVCKQCGTKFPVDPATLQEPPAPLAAAPPEAERVEQYAPPEPPPPAAPEYPSIDEEIPGSLPEQTEQMIESQPAEDVQVEAAMPDVAEQSTEAVQPFEPVYADDAAAASEKLFADLLEAAQPETAVQGAIDEAVLNQKIDELSETLDKTFGQAPPEQQADEIAETPAYAAQAQPGFDAMEEPVRADEPWQPESMVEEKTTEPFPESELDETVFIQETSPEIEAAEEFFDHEPLPQEPEQPVTEAYPAEMPAAHEPLEAPAEEELLDDALIEEAPRESIEPGGADTEPAPSQYFGDRGIPGLRDDSSDDREVTRVLKDLILPTGDIKEGSEQFVMFALEEHTFAIPIVNVLELGLPPDLTLVPNTPEWLLGIANMRGDIISVIDLRGFFNMTQEVYKKMSRMLIAQTNDRQMVVGIIVDRIKGVRYFCADEILPSEQRVPAQAAAFVKGFCTYEDEMVAFLDFEKLLQSPKMRQFQ